MDSIPIQSSRSFEALLTYLQSEVSPRILEWDEKELFPRDVFRSLHRLGMIKASIPARFGGDEWPMIDLLTLSNHLAYCSPGIFGGWLAHILFHTAVSEFATPSMARDILKSHLDGETLPSFCGTELQHGNDILSIQTVAEETDIGFLLTGSKHFITNVNFAEQLIVLAKVRLRTGEMEKGLSAFYVPRHSAGIKVGGPLRKVGIRDSDTGQIAFEQVVAPAQHLLGRKGQGLEILATCLSRTKALIAAAAYGVCRRAYDEALASLRSTVRFGEPLIQRREIQEVLSRFHVQGEAVWLLACRAGAKWDEKRISILESSEAKMFGADVSVRFVSEAIELVGARAFLRDHILQKLYRDAKAFEIYEGATLIQQALIAKELFFKPSVQ